MRILLISFALILLVNTAHAEAFRSLLVRQLSASTETATTEDEAESLAVLEAYYLSGDLRPVWVGERGVNKKGRDLSSLIATSDQDGLRPKDYGTHTISKLLNTTDPADIVALELKLSLALMQLTSDLGEGRTSPHVADPNLYPFRDEVNKGQIIEEAASTTDLDAFVAKYRPQTVRYKRAKQALAMYRELAETGGWKPIPAGDSIKPGMKNARVGLLRSHLRLWDDLKVENDRAAQGSDANYYDDDMVKAVKWMQYRHGLAQDGAVGKATLAAINVPVEDRIDQLVINLERRRWMTDDFGQRYIFVNLADFTLKLVDEPKTLLDMRVVIGKTYHKTPVFSKNMTYLVINPFWNVPPSIAGGEILPKLKKDPGYLAKKNFTLLSDWSASAQSVDPYTIDWSQVTRRNFRWRLRQGPGDGNALGRIKFMLPNHFNVYLHDTPSKSKFSQTVRSFSHGCVRVHEPTRLAAAVLTENKGWGEEEITAAITAKKRRIVKLKNPLPVHISYLTAWVNKDMSVHFRADIYDRDKQLANNLLGQRDNRFAMR